MADGVSVTPGTGVTIATKDASTPGDFISVASELEVVELGVVVGNVATSRPQTGTVTSVDDSALSQTLLSASQTRKGFRVFNTSAYDLYLKYGATATTSDFTVIVGPLVFFVEDGYGGRVDGIWAANGSGAAKITSLV